MAGKKPVQNTFKANEVIGNVYRQGNYVYLPMWENTGTTINPIGPFSSSTWTLANAFGASQWVWSNTKHGIALEVGDDNDEINSNLSDADVFTQGYGTIMVSFYVGSSGFGGSGVAFLFSIENSSNDTNIISLFVSADDTNFEFNWKRNYGSGKAVYEPDGSTQVFPNDSVVTLVCRAAPSGKKIWYNGEEVYSDAVDPGARVPQTGDTFTLHNGGSGSIAPGGYYLATGIWDSVLSDQACRELSADPFLPVRSKYYPIDALGDYTINVAWSAARYIKKSYADTKGPVLRLRKLTSNTELDFFPNDSYNKEGVIINSMGQLPSEWANGESLGVAKIYDQSGNGEDLFPESSTTNSQYARYADRTHSNGISGWAYESPSQKPTIVMDVSEGTKAYDTINPISSSYFPNWAVVCVGGVRDTGNAVLVASGAGTIGHLMMSATDVSITPDSSPTLTYSYENKTLTPRCIAMNVEAISPGSSSVTPYDIYVDNNFVGQQLGQHDWRFNIAGFEYGIGADDSNVDSTVESDQFHCEQVMFSNLSVGVVLEDDILRLMQDQANYWNTPGKKSPDGIGALSLQRTSSSIGIVYNGD